MNDRYIIVDGAAVQEPSLFKWAEWFQQADRIVKKTQVRDDVEVSTVFLGIDHRFGDGPPLLWESMVFGGEMDGECRRHTSLAEAVAGHDALVLEVTGGAS